jgi:hypothetical protein
MAALAKAKRSKNSDLRDAAAWAIERLQSKQPAPIELE